MKSSVKFILLIVLWAGYLAKAQQEEVSDLETDVESTESADVDEQNGTNQPSGGNRGGRIYGGATATAANQLYPALIHVVGFSKITQLVGVIAGPQLIYTSGSALVTTGAINGINVFVGNSPTINTLKPYAYYSYGFVSNFNPGTKVNDVAKIYLTGNLNNDTRSWNTAPLATAELAVTDTSRPNCVVLGWGQFANGSNNYILTQADYELLSAEECALELSEVLPPSVLCARSVNGYACDLDGGAPLVCNNEVYGILTDQSQCKASSIQKIQKFAKIPVIFPPPVVSTPPPRKNYVSCP